MPQLLYNGITGIESRIYVGLTNVSCASRKVRSHRELKFMVIFQYIYTFLESICKPCCIQNYVIMNGVKKWFVCTHL